MIQLRQWTRSHYISTPVCPCLIIWRIIYLWYQVTRNHSSPHQEWIFVSPVTIVTFMILMIPVSFIFPVVVFRFMILSLSAWRNINPYLVFVRFVVIRPIFYRTVCLSFLQSIIMIEEPDWLHFILIINLSEPMITVSVQWMIYLCFGSVCDGTVNRNIIWRTLSYLLDRSCTC